MKKTKRLRYTYTLEEFKEILKLKGKLIIIYNTIDEVVLEIE